MSELGSERTADIHVVDDRTWPAIAVGSCSAPSRSACAMAVATF